MKNQFNAFLASALFSAFLLTACNQHDPVKEANDANKQSSDSSSAMAVNSDDSHFATQAASGGMLEVQLGNLAGQKGQSEQVKSFGAMMVEDHTKANNELKSIAAAKNITLPAGLSDKDQQMVNDLTGKQGADFDKAYIDMMVNDHNEDISDFKKESGSGKDADISAFATRTLPTLQKHLDAAKAAQDALKGK